MELRNVMSRLAQLPHSRLGIGPFDPNCRDRDTLMKSMKARFEVFPCLTRSPTYVEFMQLYSGFTLTDPESGLIVYLDGRAVYDEWNWGDNSIILTYDPYASIAHIRYPEGERLDFSFSVKDEDGETVFCTTKLARFDDVLYAVPYAKTFLEFLQMIADTKGMLPIPESLAPHVRKRKPRASKPRKMTTPTPPAQLSALFAALAAVPDVELGKGISGSAFERQTLHMIKQARLDERAPDYATFLRQYGGACIVREEKGIYVDLVGPEADCEVGWDDTVFEMDLVDTIPVCFVQLPGSDPEMSERYDYFMKADLGYVKSEAIYWVSSTLPQTTPKLFCKTFVQFITKLIESQGEIRPVVRR